MSQYLPEDVIKGVFLLILAIAGNFVAETLGCQTQKILSENMFAKQFVIIAVIYFAMTMTNSETIMRSPLQDIIMSLAIWILFILFTRMHLLPTVIVFGLLCIQYVLYNYIKYYRENKRVIQPLKTCVKLAKISTLITLMVGFSAYLYKQYSCYHDDWNTLIFLFGKTTCTSLSKS